MNLLAGVEKPAARLDMVGLEERVSDRKTFGSKERETHCPTDDESVDDAQQRFDHTQLVRDLRATEDGNEWMFRRIAQTEQHLHFTFEEPAHRRGQRLGWTHDRRM